MFVNLGGGADSAGTEELKAAIEAETTERVEADTALSNQIGDMMQKTVAAFEELFAGNKYVKSESFSQLVGACKDLFYAPDMESERALYYEPSVVQEEPGSLQFTRESADDFEKTIWYVKPFTEPYCTIRDADEQDYYICALNGSGQVITGAYVHILPGEEAVIYFPEAHPLREGPIAPKPLPCYILWRSIGQ